MMKPGYLLLLIGAAGLWSSGAALAAETCRRVGDAINNSNSVILLGGTAKGQIKQVVMGEFGKNVNSQKRVLGPISATTKTIGTWCWRWSSM